jgi:hypothetical protein
MALGRRTIRMRTPLIVLFVLLLSAAIVGAVHGPSISFDKEAHDYGKVIYGETVTEEFVLTNTGDLPLTIGELHASCGCTKAVKGSSEVPPNGQTKIVAAFDTTGMKAGRKQKFVTVHSNDPQRPEVKLTLLADVIRELSVEQETLATTVPRAADHVTFPMKITNSSDKPVTVRDVKTPPEGSPAELQPGKIVVAPQSSVPFSVTVKLVDDPGRAYWNGRFSLETDHPREKQIDIRYLVKLEQ